MNTRTFGSIYTKLRDNDGRHRWVCGYKFNILSQNLNTQIIPLVCLAIHNSDPTILWDMLALKCKTLFGIDPKEEKDAFLRKVLRFDPDSVVVNIAEKTIKFSLEHSTLREVFELLNQVYVQNQYDVSRENVAGKTVVDVGANIGDFSMLCAVLGAKKVYAFEPDEKYFEILKNAIRENGFENIIIPINKKLGWLNKYEIIKLDSFLNGEEVDFIKIDVEGNEANVLIGATNIIRKFKPTLSFSAYHNPSDKEVLPKIVRDIESKYEITLNSYAEEDFYCEARR